LLDTLLSVIPVLAFDAAAANVDGAIVARAGYSRRKPLDRMIAAHALVHRTTLVTMNPAAFRDIAGLEMFVWRSSIGTESLSLKWAKDSDPLIDPLIESTARLPACRHSIRVSARSRVGGSQHERRAERSGHPTPAPASSAVRCCEQRGCLVAL